MPEIIDDKPAEIKPDELMGDGNFLFRNKENNSHTPAAEEKPTEEKPADEKPADEKPAEVTPETEKPAEEKPAEEKPAEEKVVDKSATDEPLSIVPDSILNPDKEKGSEEEEYNVPEGMDEKAKNAFFEKYRKQLKENDATIKELNEKLQQQGDPEEVKTLKDQLSEAHDTIGKLDLSSHPLFKQKFEAPRAAIIARVKEAIKDVEGDESIADKAAGMTIGQRIRYLTEQLPDLQAALIPMFSSIDTLDAEKASALANHKQTSEQMKSAIETQQIQKKTELRSTVINAAISNLSDSDHFAFRKGKGDEMQAWNADVDKRIEQGKALLDSEDVLSQTQFMIAGVAVPTYLNVIKELTLKNDKLNAEIKKHRGVNPNIGASDDPVEPSETIDKTKGMSSTSAAERVVSKMNSIVKK